MRTHATTRTFRAGLSRIHIRQQRAAVREARDAQRQARLQRLSMLRRRLLFLVGHARPALYHTHRDARCVHAQLKLAGPELCQVVNIAVGVHAFQLAQVARVRLHPDCPALARLSSAPRGVSAEGKLQPTACSGRAAVAEPHLRRIAGHGGSAARAGAEPQHEPRNPGLQARKLRVTWHAQWRNAARSAAHAGRYQARKRTAV